MQNDNTIERQKHIFQIGFNKCGTASLHQFFNKNGYKSIHWDDGKLSLKMQDNYNKGLPLLSGYENFNAFTDMEHRAKSNKAFYSYADFYQLLDQQYPDSLFVLNFRHIDNWITSRINHPGYLQKTMKGDKLSAGEVKQKWEKHYYDHIREVRNYFKGRENLLVLDLDTVCSHCINEFFTANGIELKLKNLPHSHKTKIDNPKRDGHINSIQAAADFFESQGNTDIAKKIKDCVDIANSKDLDLEKIGKNVVIDKASTAKKQGFKQKVIALAKRATS